MKKLYKLFSIIFFMFWFGFLIFAAYICLRDKNYGMLLYSGLFWIAGIVFAKKKLFDVKPKKTKFGIPAIGIVILVISWITLFVVGFGLLIQGILEKEFGLFFMGAFFFFGTIAFILGILTIKGCFDNCKIDVLGTYLKTFAVLSAIGFIVLMLTGCGNVNRNDVIENEASIVGTITEVNSDNIQIYIKNDGYPSGALCYVLLDVKDKERKYSPMKVGDEVVVYFNGEIAESDPMQINTVYGIALQRNAKPEGTYTQINMSEAISMMETEENYIILDVRTPEEYAQKHIPNAINIPNEVIGTEEIEELPDKSQIILVYCRSGNRSKQASKKLAALGYTNVYEFGGINDWPGETVMP